MVKISLILLLFIIQFLLIFVGLTVLFYRKYNKQKNSAVVAQVKVKRLAEEITSSDEKDEELSSIKDELINVQEQFQQVTHLNAKLKEAIDKLIPQAERTKDHEVLIKDIEQYYIELDSFARTLRNEKEQLLAKAEAHEKDIAKISLKLKDSISKEDHDYVQAQNNRLELERDKLKGELDEAKTSYSELEKNYMWLEKEYNALYENVSSGKA